MSKTLTAKLQGAGLVLLSALNTLLLYCWNKIAAFTVLAILVICWFATGNGDTPFAEFFYAGILIMGIAIVAPALRLLMFPEAAQYAESGKLRDDIGLAPHVEGVLRPAARFSPALVHYWFATGLCYAIVGSGAIALQNTGL